MVYIPLLSESKIKDCLVMLITINIVYRAFSDSQNQVFQKRLLGAVTWLFNGEFEML